MPALFETGQITVTQGALAVIPQPVMVSALRRHLTGDWGLCGVEDAKENDLSVRQGFRILSVYEHEGTRFWVITEADRTATTFLLPSEY
jgi:hypothetical protein